jgi:hypothetical protein
MQLLVSAAGRRELNEPAATSRRAMENADPTRPPCGAAVESEALRVLPNVARDSRLLTRSAVDADDLAQ